MFTGKFASFAWLFFAVLWVPAGQARDDHERGRLCADVIQRAASQSVRDPGKAQPPIPTAILGTKADADLLQQSLDKALSEYRVVSDSESYLRYVNMLRRYGYTGPVEHFYTKGPEGLEGADPAHVDDAILGQEIGVAERVTFKDFESIVNRHGLTVHGKLKSKHQAPGNLSPEELNAARQIISLDFVQKMIEREALHKKAGAEEKADQELIDTIKRMQRGTLVNENVINHLKRLTTRILELSGRAQKLRDSHSASGHSEAMTWQYLKSNNAEFRKKLKEKDADQKLIIVHPVMDEGGELSLKVRGIANLDEYEKFYREYQLKGEQVLKYHDELMAYTRDYMRWRALSDMVTAIDANKQIFSFNAHEKADVAKQDTPVIVIPGAPTKVVAPEKSDFTVLSDEADVAYAKKLRDESVAEEVRRREFNKLRDAIEKGFAHSKPVHPHPDHMAEITWAQQFKRSKLWAEYWHLSFLGLALPVTATVTVMRIFREKVVVPIANVLDEQNALDERYWIERCGEKTSKKELDECIKRFGDVAMAQISKQVVAKREKNPLYQPDFEKEHFAEMFRRVIVATYVMSSFEVWAAIQADLDLKYIPEGEYDREKIAREQKNKQKIPAEIEKKNEQDNKRQKGQFATAKDMGIDEALWARKRVDALTREYTDKIATFKQDIGAFRDDALNTGKREGYDEQFRKHMMYLMGNAKYFEFVRQQNPPKDALEQLIVLEELNAEEINRVHAENSEFLVKAGKIQATPAAAPKAEPPAAAGAKPVVSPETSQVSGGAEAQK